MASLSITNSQSMLKLMSIESLMPSNHLILCHLLLLPSVFPSIKVFSNELSLLIRWSKYWSFSFSIQFSSVQFSRSVMSNSLRPHGLQHKCSLSFTISQSLLKLMSIESVMPSNHLILCHPLLLLFSVFPIIRVFFNESALCIRWSKYWSFSFSISPSNE